MDKNKCPFLKKPVTFFLEKTCILKIMDYPLKNVST